MGSVRASVCLLAVGACALLALVVTAPAARAQDEALPPLGPRSVPAPLPGEGWTPAPAPAPRLVRAQPAYAPAAASAPYGAWTTPPWTSQGAPARVAPVAWQQPGTTYRPYDITSGAWRARGPVEVRDYWLIAQPRMTLPAVSPDAPRHGSWTITFHIDRGNDFGWIQNVAGESPSDRRFLIDGEHQSTELRVRYGLLPRLSLGIRVPVYWRGGGFMDQPIDWFHELFEGIGFLDNGRPAFDTDRYRVEGRTTDGGTFSWNDKRGTALGNIDLEAYWHIRKACRRCDWRVAWILRAALPTGGDPYDSGFDLGTQLVVAKQVGSRFDLYAGIGGTWFSDDELDGIEYESVRGAAFFAVEWHATSRWSFIAETNAASRLATNIRDYPGVSWYINISTRYDITSCFEVYLGFTENLEDQQGTIDFGGFAGFTLKL